MMVHFWCTRSALTFVQSSAMNDAARFHPAGGSCPPSSIFEFEQLGPALRRKSWSPPAKKGGMRHLAGLLDPSFPTTARMRERRP